MAKSKPRKKYVPKGKQIPMLLFRGLRNTSLELQERMAVEAFAQGYATSDHYDLLADMQGVLLIAGIAFEKNAHVMNYARHVVGDALVGIKDRYKATKEFSCAPEELEVLQKFVGTYRDFWLKQSHELYEICCNELSRQYKIMAAQETSEATPA